MPIVGILLNRLLLLLPPVELDLAELGLEV
jgi:hypothetical protein